MSMMLHCIPSRRRCAWRRSAFPSLQVCHRLVNLPNADNMNVRLQRSNIDTATQTTLVCTPPSRSFALTEPQAAESRRSEVGLKTG